MLSPPRKRLKLDRPTTPTFLDLFLTDRFRPIRTAFTSYISTADLLQLASTCHTARNAIYESEWNINSKLRPFLCDPVGFRNQLALCNGLISGSFALQFLERVTWPESDLDIFVEDGVDAECMCEYLIEEEGYIQGEEKGRIGYIDIDLTMIATFTKDNRKIQVIAADGPPIRMILRSFYSTVVMNVITWNKAFALFPRTTFLQHDAYPLARLTDYYAQLHSKYTHRGWSSRTLPEEEDLSPELDGYRRMGDKMAWQMSLDTHWVDPPERPDFVLEYCQFKVTTRPVGLEQTWRDFERTSAFRIEAPLWFSNVLRYEYTFAHNYKFGARMDRSTLAQLWALEPSERKRLIGNQDPFEMQPRFLVFDKPEGWEHLDEEYIRLIDDLESEGYFEGLL
ncbi:hypothetical protein BT63DRAFT_476162 [Microthyrium microscopicum]|uniref:Uncharacterized protein n=1 Tax=Microthyrium microscopicum TaxID=703497 RepID=A0A6A6UN35_9PEZI|nr:hypothetical protein BT63DRAFT_476162 [Microthyrium microscopicum]